MITNIKNLLRKYFILIKIFFINFFSIKVLGNKPVLKIPAGASIEVRASRRKLRALERAFQKNPENFTHSNYLNMLTLSSIINSNLSNDEELNKNLDEIIKVCIDWKSRKRDKK
jgi:hypothetical protein